MPPNSPSSVADLGRICRSSGVAAGLNRRRAVILLVSFCLAAASCMRAPPPSKPNIVLISFDTMRADFLRAYGDATTQTPHFDAFAREAAVFQNAFASSPFTPPSIWSLLRSVHIHESSYDTLFRVRYAASPALAQRLRKAGYTTVGFTGSSILNRGSGYDAGFEAFFDTGNAPFHHNEKVFSRLDEFLDDFAEAPAKPFFLYAHFYDPHPQWADAPQRFHRYATGEQKAAERYPRSFAAYRSEITWADDIWGRLLGKLNRRQLRDNTIVAFTSDHGFAFREHYDTFGYVFHLFDEAIRIPFMLKAPGLKPRTIETPISLVDLGPTLLDLAGLGKTHGDGVSFLQRLKDPDEKAPVPVFAQASAMLPSQWEEGPYRNDFQSRYAAGVDNIHMMMVEDDFKLIHMPSRTPEQFELYNRRVDPAEQTDIYDAQNPRHREMAARLLKQRGALAKRYPRHGKKDDAKAVAEAKERLRALGYVK